MIDVGFAASFIYVSWLHTFAVSNVCIPMSYLGYEDDSAVVLTSCPLIIYAALMWASASSSPSNHGCHSLLPYCIVPMMRRETLRPESPRRTKIVRRISSITLILSNHVKRHTVWYFLSLDVTHVVWQRSQMGRILLAQTGIKQAR